MFRKRHHFPNDTSLKSILVTNPAPPGWRHNPSSFSRRARVASIAAIAASLILILDAPSPAVQATCAFASLGVGVFTLLGSSHRWASAPWLVALDALVAFVGLTQTALLVSTYANERRIDGAVLAYVALSFLMAGAILDEGLASAQLLRRHADRGRSLWRAFFGFKSRRRAGRSVTLDDVTTPTTPLRGPP